MDTVLEVLACEDDDYEEGDMDYPYCKCGHLLLHHKPDPDSPQDMICGEDNCQCGGYEDEDEDDDMDGDGDEGGWEEDEED